MLFLFLLRGPMREGRYQGELIERLERMFPGCVVIKNDALYCQGIPDLTIFYMDRWAMLEVKTSQNAPEQPNQRYWVDLFNDMSYASFIYPENEEEVLNDLQLTFRFNR